MASVGLWERGVEGWGVSPPSARLLPHFIVFPVLRRETPTFRHTPEARRASKALTISPSGETGFSARSAVEGCAQ